MGLRLHHPGDKYKLIFVYESETYVTVREASGTVPLVCLHGRLLAADTPTHDSDLVQGEKNQTFVSRQDLYLVFGLRCASTDRWLQRGHSSPNKHPRPPTCLIADVNIALASWRHRSCRFPGEVRTYATTPDSESLYIFKCSKRTNVHHNLPSNAQSSVQVSTVVRTFSFVIHWKPHPV